MANSEKLRDWRELADDGWRSLFLGNGFSINISAGFGYDKLFDEAELSDVAVALFDRVKSTNFELVLERLLFAQQMNEAFGFPEAALKRQAAEHDGIREALFGAVAKTHIKHADIPAEHFRRISERLLTYDRVFTTNYDLLPYWSLMSSADSGTFMDLFRNRDGELIFDPAIATWWPERTRVFYLHGGLHLWRDDWTGVVGKWQATPAGLLDLEERYEKFPDRQPLLVSEGTAAHKRAAIQRNGYLGYVLQELTRDTAPLVVVGSSFGDSDDHIVQAITAGARGRKIAVGIYAGRLSAIRIQQRIIDLRVRLEGHEVKFFDVTTHPLTDPELHVT